MTYGAIATLLLESTMVKYIFITGGVLSSVGKDILAEAATVVEQRMKDKFPDLPSAMPTTADKTHGKTQLTIPLSTITTSSCDFL